MANSMSPYSSGVTSTQALAGFASWWGARLRECLPKSVLRWLSGDRHLPILGMHQAHLCLWSAHDQPKLLHRFALDTERQNNSAQLAAMLRPLAEVKNGVAVLAAEEHVLRRLVELPAAAAANLRQTLAYDLDRLTPYPGEQILFDAQALELKADERKLKAELVATPKPLLAPLLLACQEAGVVVERVLPSLKEADAGFNLESAVTTVRARPWYRRVWPWASLACLVLLAVALLFPLWQKRQRIILTQQLLVEAQKAALAAEAVQKEVLAKSTQYNTLLAKRHSMPLAVQLLDEVSRKVPDDTWVQNFELRSNKQNRELMLVGDTNSSSKLISWFEGSPLFAQASFKSPLTRNQAAGPNAERFQVALEVKSVALPTPVSLTEAKTESKADTKPETKADNKSDSKADAKAPATPTVAGSKDITKESSKEPAKELPKSSPKDAVKDLSKEPAKAVKA
ncbi:MAG: hypothetical protein RLZZ502_804 [Pseudomonadota bacterium]